MIASRKAILTALAVVGLASAAAAQSPPFVADFTASGFPDYNFSSCIDPGGTPEWSRAAVSGVGPSGGDVLRLTSLALDNEGEFGWGCDKAMTPPSQGTIWYVRVYSRWTATTNFQGYDPLDGGDTIYMNGKHIMLPDHGGVSGIRVSLNWESQHSPTTGFIKWYVGQASGGPSTAYVAERGVWGAIQMRVTPSSTCGAGDGSIRFWYNNDNESSPTQVTHDGTTWVNDSTGLDICNSAWDNLRVGAYINKGLQDTGIHAMEIGAVEIGTTFDPSWYADMGTGGVGGSSSGAVRLRRRGEP